MPLARMALYAQGIEVLVAPTWDCGDGWLASMRHIAREGGCWVIGCAAAVQGSDMPADLPGREQMFPNEDEWLCSGDSVVMAPFGGPVAGPLHRERGIVYADLDHSKVTDARRSFDVAGHYNRTDVFCRRKGERYQGGCVLQPIICQLRQNLFMLVNLRF